MNYHSIIPTPFGKAAVIFQKEPFLLKRVLLPQKTGKGLETVLPKDEWGRSGNHENALCVSGMIKDYFNGRPIKPPWKWMEMGHLTELQKTVLHAVAAIPFGDVRSYKDIAHAIGSPRAYRFVGTTMAKNRFPILVPCHRVIKSDNTTGAFGGGAELKKKMIKLEQDSIELKFIRI